MEIHSEEIVIQADDVSLAGTLAIPEQAAGIVLFAHGSGSSRFSPRNRWVARALNEAGNATLLFDLLSADEHAKDAMSGAYRFDIELLARRLVAAIDWVQERPETRLLRVGLFGASTGAAAALVAAAERKRCVRAVVSRGGRPDLAGSAIIQVKAPTLLIVGGLDGLVIQVNREAAARMGARNQVVIVPGAGHLFEEPGKLEEVAALARDWFWNELAPRRRLSDKSHEAVRADHALRGRS